MLLCINISLCVCMCLCVYTLCPVCLLFFFFFSGFIHFIILFIKLCGGYSWGLGPLHRDSGVGLHKMVSKFLIWRLGEHRLFPEIRGEITIGLGNGVKSGLGEVAQGGGAAPGRSVAVVRTGIMSLKKEKLFCKQNASRNHLKPDLPMELGF